MYFLTECLEQAPLPDNFRGIHKGDGAGQKYADEIKIIIDKANDEGKQVVNAQNSFELSKYHHVCTCRWLASLLKPFWAVLVRSNFLMDSLRLHLSELTLTNA